jgi:hypothetical protein
MKMTKTVGVVKDGVIVPNIPIPEGFRVLIEFSEEQLLFTPEEQAEFDEWDELSRRSLETTDRMIEEKPDDEAGRSLAG